MTAGSRAPARWFVRALVVIFAMQVTANAVRPTVSYRALDLGADAMALGFIAAGFSVISLVLAIPIGRQVDRRGEMPFIVLGVVLVCGVSLSLVVVETVWALFLTQAVLGLGQILTTIGMQALIANSGQAGPESRFSAFTVVVSLGQIVGPALAGLAADFLRLPEGLLPGGAVGLAGSGAFLLGAVVALVGVVVAILNRHAGSGPRPARVSGDVPPESLFRGVGQVLRQPSAPRRCSPASRC